jgi:hypothetical protein
MKIAANRSDNHPIDDPVTRLPDYPIRLSFLAALLVLALFAAGVTAQAPEDLGSVLGRVGDRLLEYYSRAQSIVCLERVMVQQIGSDLTPFGFARVIEYELRVEWDAGTDGAAPEATVHREVRRVNGRPARPGDEPKCMDPRTISPEPLAFMLPGNRDEYVFSLGRPGRGRDRSALILDYRTRVDDEAGPSEVTTKDDCTFFSIPAGLKGRLWLNPETHNILRVDQGLKRRFEVRVPSKQTRFGQADYFTVERYESSVRYRPVSFQDPEETVLLPESITELMVVSGGSHAGKRTTQTYSGYKRFITGGRIVK